MNEWKCWFQVGDDYCLRWNYLPSGEKNKLDSLKSVEYTVLKSLALTGFTQHCICLINNRPSNCFLKLIIFSISTIEHVRKKILNRSKEAFDRHVNGTSEDTEDLSTEDLNEFFQDRHLCLKPSDLRARATNE